MVYNLRQSETIPHLPRMGAGLDEQSKDAPIDAGLSCLNVPELLRRWSLPLRNLSPLKAGTI